jgi:hypothetical protein
MRIPRDRADFLRRLTPIVEASFQSPVANSFAGERTTGTVNPGIIYSGDTYQLAIEAMIPSTQSQWQACWGDRATALFPRRYLPQLDRQADNVDPRFHQRNSPIVNQVSRFRRSGDNVTTPCSIS